jgi:thioredoxin-dependent peroxiredoxin
MLNVGDKAPEFSLIDQNGSTVKLTDFRGGKVLIWFYPKASTPGCTVEGCNIRDHQSEFTQNEICIIGISKDSVKRQKNFATKHAFEYPLLSDESGETIEAFGAWGPKKFMGREYEGILRSSFLIDEDGIIERVFAKVKTKTHGADVLQSIVS